MYTSALIALLTSYVYVSNSRVRSYLIDAVLWGKLFSRGMSSGKGAFCPGANCHRGKYSLCIQKKGVGWSPGLIVTGV